MHQPNSQHQRKADLDLEEAEAYLWFQVLTHEQAWPPHYPEAIHRLDAILAKMLDPEQVEEVRDAVVQVLGAVETVQLRIGFSLGRTWGAYGELTEADACRAVEAAGGNPGRALAEVIEHELAGIAPEGV
jgi:hypothetical protein